MEKSWSPIRNRGVQRRTDVTEEAVVTQAVLDDTHSDNASGPRLIPQLPRAATIILTGDAISALGQGMTLPFLLIYLHQVRGIDMAVAGLVLSTVALASFVGNPLGGWLSD